MIPERDLHPIDIKKNAKIIKILSCSCHYTCRHNTICAIDNKGNIYKSTNSKKFTLNRELSNKKKTKGIYSTRAGVVRLTGDNELVPVESDYTLVVDKELYLEYLKNTPNQKESDLEIVDMDAYSSSPNVILLSDGSIVLKRKRAIAPHGPDIESYDNKSDGVHCLGDKNVLVSGEVLRSSTGEKATSVTSGVVRDLIVLNFDNSNEAIIFNVRQGVIKHIKADINITGFSNSARQLSIKDEFGKNHVVYRTINLRDLFLRQDNEVKTFPASNRPHVKKVWEKDLSRAELIDGGKMVLYPSKHTWRPNSSPETIQLPSPPKEVVITSNSIFVSRFNILMESGDVASMHFRK